MPELPSGTVTFLFTDIERSTQTVEAMGSEAYADALDTHRQLLREAFEAHGGHEVGTEGDAFFVAFARANDAVEAALSGQRTLDPHPLCVRMGIHTGEALVRQNDYVGHDVHKAKRISDAGHGGQILVSQVTAELVRGAVELTDLGPHRLKDLASPERLYQVGPGEFPPLRSLEAFRTNLPVQRSSFVGREAEIAEVRKLLEGNRLVTLTGVGGCGKTRLALQVAAEELDRFPDGAFFVELAPLSDPDLIPRTVAGAIGLSVGGLGEGPVGDLAELVVGHLAKRSCLLLLDNCEHLLDASAELVDTIMGRCPDVTVLATSREGLDVEGEQSYTVPSLSLPRGDADVQDSEAVSLFKARAQAAQPRFDLTPGNVADVAEVCRRLDGIPLAIELAASRVTHLSPRQIADRLEDLFRELTGGRRRVQRQQTLQATLDWSYELLEGAERVLLARLAVFWGSFGLEAVEGICADDEVGGSRIVDLLGSLVSKSLVVAEPQEDSVRYRLLEPVRLYASEKLRARGEGETLRARHRDWYLEWLEAMPSEDAAFDPHAISILERDLDNLRAAMEWSDREGRPDLVGRMASHSYGLVFLTGHHDEFHRWLARAVEDPDRLDPELRMACFAQLAGTAMLRVEPTTAGYARRAVELEPERPHGLHATALALLAVLHAPGSPEEARRLAERARDAAAPSGPWRGYMHFLTGWVELMLLDLPKACDLFAAAITEAGRTLVGAEGASRGGLAIALHLMGDDRRAHEAARAALAALERPDERGLADWTSAAANAAPLPALAAGGDVDEARSRLREILEEVRRSSTTLLVTNEVLVCCAAVEAIASRYDRAGKLLGAARTTGGVEHLPFPFRTPNAAALYVHYVNVVRDKLDPDHRRRLRDEGRAMSPDEAVAYALEGAQG